MRPKEEQWLLALRKPLLDQVLIRTPLMTGLSPAELADLQVTDIYYEYGVLFVWRSKTSVNHIAFVDADTLFLIREYAAKRKKGPLLILDKGQDLNRRMKVQIIRRIVKKWAREAGIARWKQVTPYTLRHTFCCKWVLFGGSIEALRRQLGLKGLQKLKHYLDFDIREVQGEYQRIHMEHMEKIHLHIGTPYIV